MLRSIAFLRGVTLLHTEPPGTAPPDAFGSFRVLHQIGAGTLGPVFRAYEPVEGKLAAVKLFRLDLPPDQGHRLVAALEQLLTADLAHPAIAAPLATGLAGTNAYLASDFVSADSLDIVIRDHGGAPPRDALRVAAQLAGALDFAAVVNVLHGALHPRDVLVSSDDARLTGLGVSQALDWVGVPTPTRRPYTAPERAAGAVWDRRADVFSLAALIYELLWARRVTATGGAVAATVTELPGANLEALRDVFSRALADDPADRFPTALAFAEALREGFTLTPDDLLSLPVPAPVISDQLPDDRDHDLPHVAQAFRPADRRLPLDEPGHGPGYEPEHEGGPPAQLVAAAAAADDIRPPRTPAFASVDEEDVASPVLAVPAVARPRRSAWPIVLALLIGGGVGFAIRDFIDGEGSSRSTQSEMSPPADPGAGAAPAATSGTAREVADPVPTGAVSVTEEPPSPRENLDPAISEPRTAEPRTTEPRTAEPRTPEPQNPEPVTRNPELRQPAPSASTGRFTAPLVVDSRPAGASVFLDGKLLGKTPITLNGVNAGEHAVRLELDGYRRWTASVRVVAGERNRIAASLER